ncbi:MAG TPA: translocation/assembly module TamB domain-containing protein [Vicinamibacterales bacterium]|nr:translocation/assembly module TamB domain-containing protein [Vicinamibacterales bacterium]
MRVIRRVLQVVAVLGTLIVGAVAVALIVSQTPWFRDWLRRYIVRESRQYLNGELTIGALSGNLFFGVNLSDIAVDISGTRVVAVKGLQVDYSVFQLISEGIVLDEITIVEPRLRLERDSQGWNVGHIIKPRRREADREGPGRPVRLQAIRVSDGAVDVDDRQPSDAVRLPDRIADLDVRAAFAYEPVRFSVDVEHLSFRTGSPRFALRQLTGRLAVRDDDLHLEDVVLRSPETAVNVDGVIRDYLGTPVLKLTATGRVSLPEIGRIVPAAAGYPLAPEFDIKASGPARQLKLDLDVKSDAGRIRGDVTADVQAPGYAVKGTLQTERLDLAPILKNPAQRSDLTGRTTVDVRLASEPAALPAAERLSGTFRFSGPRVMAAGYEAADVRAEGSFQAGRLRLHAAASAYGGSATATGALRLPAGERPLAFDLRGRADRVNLETLPRTTGAPALATNLSVTEYEIKGEGRAISGRVVLDQSTVEGATIEQGTIASFTSKGAGDVTYTARGGVADLDLRRLGRALDVAALDDPLYEGRINGRFDVTGAGTKIDRMTLDASGVLSNTALAGARLDDFAFETHLRNGALEGTVKGRFADVNPATVAKRADLEGSVSGSADLRVELATLEGPLTPESVEAAGRLDIERSSVGELTIERATVQGEYANRVGNITTLELASPDLAVNASGRLALDGASESSLTYHIEATDLAALGRLAGRKDLDGSAILDGRVSGNAVSLTTTGTLQGSNLTYGDNNALDLDSTYTVTIPELTPADARVEATTTATFVKAGGLQLNEVTATTTYTSHQLDFKANLQEQKRELDATGRVIFHPDHQEIHLPELAIRTEGLEWRMAGGGDPRIQYGQDRLTVDDIRLVNGPQSLDLQGTLALKGETPTGTLDVKAANVDLAQLEQLLLQERGLTGTLSADATITGSSAAPIVDGRVEVREGGFRSYQYESLVADVDYQGNRIGLDATLQQSPTEAITARGSVPMTLFARGEAGHVEETPEDRIDLRIQSTALGLGLIQGFTTSVTNVTGTIEADVRVTGSGRDPHLEGHIDIRNGAFGVPLGGTAYSGLDTRIDLTTDLVRIQSFDILDENGARLSVSGQLAVHERKVGAVDVSINSKNFEVIDNELGDVGLDSSIRITGELRSPRIEGEIRTATARIEVDQVLQLFYDPYEVDSMPAVVSAERTVAGSGSAEEATRQALARARTTGAAPAEPVPADEGAPAPGGAFAPVSMDVRVVIPDNLVLRGNDLRPGGPTGAALGDINVTVGGDLRLRKKSGGPMTIVGTANPVRGTYTFQGRRFELSRKGTVRFTGDAEINPLLDITAVRQIPDSGVEAQIRITGTTRAPQLELTSTPPLEQSDILAMIIFNRPVNELGSGERASLAATAGGIATGFIAAPLGESIGRALDLDLFEITTTTEDGDFGAGITLGQQIGDRAFLKFRQQFGEQSTTEFMIEYQLASFLRLQATGAPQTSGSANRITQRRVERAGIDVIFFFSY